MRHGGGGSAVMLACAGGSKFVVSTLVTLRADLQAGLQCPPAYTTPLCCMLLTSLCQQVRVGSASRARSRLGVLVLAFPR
eukprot:15459134-Alexandrium_andersonii.AAC.1